MARPRKSKSPIGTVGALIIVKARNAKGALYALGRSRDSDVDWQINGQQVEAYLNEIIDLVESLHDA